jgi:hypothetical protein
MVVGIDFAACNDPFDHSQRSTEQFVPSLSLCANLRQGTPNSIADWVLSAIFPFYALFRGISNIASASLSGGISFASVFNPTEPTCQVLLLYLLQSVVFASGIFLVDHWIPLRMVMRVSILFVSHSRRRVDSALLRIPVKKVSNRIELRLTVTDRSKAMWTKTLPKSSAESKLNPTSIFANAI